VLAEGVRNDKLKGEYGKRTTPLGIQTQTVTDFRKQFPTLLLPYEFYETQNWDKPIYTLQDLSQLKLNGTRDDP
jgi:hypothetical protein